MPRIHQVEIPVHPEAVAEVRRAVFDFDELPAGTLSDIELIASELATNAVRHAGLRPEATVAVTLRQEADRVRVEVEGRSEGFTRASVGGIKPSVEGGYGLKIVELIADRWDVDPHRGVVWAELRVAA
jgi:anti-sigma regulatory factor (Ser/Thr protein kinase)